MYRTEEPIRVLIVDDDPASLALLEHRITSRGYGVLTAADGETALKLIQEETPQIIIADWMMEGLDGLSLVRQVRQSTELPFSYFILVSGRSEKADIAEGLDAGADDFISKPIDERELFARLKAAERILHLETFYRRHTQRLQKVNLETTMLNERIHRLSDEVREARRQAVTTSESCRNLLTDMSHEIRSPMTAILGYAELLQSRGDLSKAPPERVEAVETILRNCHHLLEMVNNVLDLEKLLSGRPTPQWSACDPGELANEVRMLFLPRAEERGVTLVVDRSSVVPRRLRSDPQRLRQILINLVSNAVKFTEKGEVRISLEFHPVTPENVGEYSGDAPQRIGELCIRVTDTGLGMTSDELGVLFHRFSQANTGDPRALQGAGLGLFISRKLAQLLGGEITAESAPGCGSTFTIQLPIDSLVEVTVHASSSTAVDAEEARADLRGHSILIAEDCPDTQRLLVSTLRDCGAVPLVAENGRAALEIWLTSHRADRMIDMVVTDKRLPGLEGVELLRELRRAGYIGPVICLSGDTDNDKDAGFDECAEKPIRRSQLFTLLRRYLKECGSTSTTLPTPQAAIVSTFADDADIRELVEVYVHELPARVAAIREAYQQEDLSTLSRLIHQLKGSAGGYGFAPITEAARCLNESVKAGRSLQSMRVQIEELTELCHRARATRQES